MHFLPIRLSGEIQSWGGESKFQERTTNSFPTKSGIIGILASALGITREETEKLKTSGLLDLEICVRADKKGLLLKDFHSYRPYNKNQSKLSNRYYISDACFLVGLYSPNDNKQELLNEIYLSLQAPKNALFLGRKACPPREPIFITPPEEYDNPLHFLQDYPFLPQKKDISREENNKEIWTLLGIIPSKEPGSIVLKTTPISFSKEKREFSSHSIKQISVKKNNPWYKKNTTFDPFNI